MARKSNRIISLGMILLSLFQIANAAIPVFDEINYLLQRTIQRWQKIINLDIIKNLKDFRTLQELAYVSMMVQSMGLSGGEIVSLRPADIGEILRMGAFISDLEDRDTWSRIFKRFETLTSRFKFIRDFGFVRKNPLYRQHSTYRAFVDRNLEIEEEKLQNDENLIELFTTMREIEEERLDFFSKYQDLLAQYGGMSDPKTGAAQTGKLLAVLAFIQLESLKADMQTNLLVRSFLEGQVKTNVWDRDFYQRWMELNKHNPEVWK